MSEFINLAARDTAAQDLVKQHLARVWSAPQYTPEQEEEYKRRIKSLLKRHNAVLVAHYYTDPLIQALAEETGGCVSDSLEMARFGKNHSADTLIVAGVNLWVRQPKFSPLRSVCLCQLWRRPVRWIWVVPPRSFPHFAISTRIARW